VDLVYFERAGHIFLEGVVFVEAEHGIGPAEIDLGHLLCLLAVEFHCDVDGMLVEGYHLRFSLSVAALGGVVAAHDGVDVGVDDGLFLEVKLQDLQQLRQLLEKLHLGIHRNVYFEEQQGQGYVLYGERSKSTLTVLQ